MRKIWVWAAAVLTVACQSKETVSSGAATEKAPAASVTASMAPNSRNPAPSGACLSELDYLVPPTQYGDSDLVRAIVVDGDQAYFRNMTDVFRVPLTGGQPTALSKGPGLLLSGRAVLWASGDRLLTQSAGEPIFMASPKSGGAWSNLIDLTAAKLGGGRDAATRILQGLGGRANAVRASQAAFDGENFYWAEITRGKGPNAPSSSMVKSVPLAGGEARTLFTTAGEVGEVVRANDRLVFVRTAPPSAEQLKKHARGDSHLMAIPSSGGDARELMRISHFIANVVLGADGKNVYVSGYQNEDLLKPGIFRVDAASGSVEQLDQRALHGAVFVSGERLVFIGEGMLEPGKLESGQLVLTTERNGKSLSRAACISSRYTLHASAVSHRTALLALFKSGEKPLASIAKIPLP
jgi:hypothetical protein